LRWGSCWGSLVRAQTAAQRPAAPARDPVLDEADRWLQNMDWSRAAEAHERVLRRDPNNAQAWFHLGVASRTRRISAGRSRRSRRRVARPSDSPKMAWEAAMANARLKRADRAIEWLSTVVDGGLRSQVLTSTPEFEFVRADPSFQALLSRAAGSDVGCSGAAYRGLDFWVGDWAIYDQDRVRVGTNRVARTPDGCAYVETWSGTLGDGGRSLNYFDRVASRWKQVWIGDTGGLVEQTARLSTAS
jgi:hypothetical protein